MVLSEDLLSMFAKATKDEKPKDRESTVYGKVVEYDGNKYVKLDGSELLTPVDSTTAMEDGERVTVLIKNHTATVTGNITSPAARKVTVDKLTDEVNEIGTILADKVSTKDLEAERARIDNLEADNVTIHGTLDAVEANIETINADNVNIKEKLTASEADINKLKTDKLDATAADIKYATIENLDATNVNVRNLKADFGKFADLTTTNFESTDAKIANLEATKLDAETADLKYAKIDFANINMAAVQKLFSDSGIIKDLVVSEGRITGELVGVTIKGDLIEAGSLKADKLVVLGEDGLYYKLNVNALGETTASSDPKYQNGLDGSTIIAKSITATKVAVDDLVAFGATIGGFHICDHSLYSGVKDGINNTTAGIYLGDDGQLYIGDADNRLRFYKSAEDGKWKLEVSASSITFGSSQKNLETAIDELRDETTTFLYIESSRGTVFKNDNVSTLLSVVIYRGSDRITDMKTLRSLMGPDVYLQWKWQHINDEEYGIISSDDKRIGNDGFTFLLSPGDVDTKVTFICELIK